MFAAWPRLVFEHARLRLISDLQAFSSAPQFAYFNAAFFTTSPKCLFQFTLLHSVMPQTFKFSDSPDRLAV